MIFLISLSCWEIASLTAAQFASGVDLVEVYVSVIDSSGAPVPALSRDEFVVEEDGKRQEIRAFSAGAFPLSLAIGIDHSFSMARVGMPGIARAARGFLSALRPEDQAMVVGIGSQTEVLAPLSTDRALALDAIDRLAPWGTTPLYDATASAVDAIESASGRRALILISDGTDRYSDTRAADVLDRVRRKDVLIYPVALGRARDAVFTEMATVTGGRSFQVANVSGLPAALSTIADELRFQYLLGYAPPAGRGPGWRSIQVRVTRANLRVRAREGYAAP